MRIDSRKQCAGFAAPPPSRAENPSMTQSRLGSAIETLFNIAIGLVVAMIMCRLVFPLYGIHVSVGTDARIAGWFTIASIVRGYVIRRWFNARLRRAAERLATLRNTNTKHETGDSL